MVDGQPETGSQNGPETGQQHGGPTGTGQGTETGPAGSGTGPETGQVEDPATELAKWKALSQQNEARAKANAEAAKKLAAIEESQKTEQQKLADRLAAAEKRAADAELAALRADVASAKGIPPALAGRLLGSTREELDADADNLLKHLGKPTDKLKPPPAVAVAGNGAGQGGRTAEEVFASLIRGD
jgi:hypothetical protein